MQELVEEGKVAPFCPNQKVVIAFFKQRRKKMEKRPMEINFVCALWSQPVIQNKQEQSQRFQHGYRPWRDTMLFRVSDSGEDQHLCKRLLFSRLYFAGWETFKFPILQNMKRTGGQIASWLSGSCTSASLRGRFRVQTESQNSFGRWFDCNGWSLCAILVGKVCYL